MFRTTILLLGAPRIERDGVPVEVDTRKAIALAAYLAVTKQKPHQGRARRPALARVQPESRPRRPTQDPLVAGEGPRGGLVARRQGERGPGPRRYLGRRSPFQDLLAGCKEHGHPESEVCPECLPLLTEAVELYRDDFMAGFGLRDSVAFDDWQFFQSESLRRELAGALERLARGRGALGEWEAAVAHARRWLAIDVLHEPAHRMLMALYAWSDQRAAALRQYRECVRVLDQELGVAPLEETTLLYRAIQENDLPPRPALSEHGRRSGESRVRGPSSKLTQRTAPPDNPLVGRDPEWEALLGSYASIGEGGRVVVVEGEAGIGKTRLAEEFVAHVRERGATRRNRALLRGREEPGLRAFRRRPLRRPRPGGPGPPEGLAGRIPARGGPPVATDLSPDLVAGPAARHAGRQEPLLQRKSSGSCSRSSTVLPLVSSFSTTCTGPTTPLWAC